MQQQLAHRSIRIASLKSQVRGCEISEPLRWPLVWRQRYGTARGAHLQGFEYWIFTGSNLKFRRSLHKFQILIQILEFTIMKQQSGEFGDLYLVTFGNEFIENLSKLMNMWVLQIQSPTRRCSRWACEGSWSNRQERSGPPKWRVMSGNPDTP